MFSWEKKYLSRSAKRKQHFMMKTHYEFDEDAILNFIKFCSLAWEIKPPKVQLVFTLFEARTEICPFVSILNLNATTYPWIKPELKFGPNSF